MPKQNSIIKLTGKMDGISFYKRRDGVHIARKAVGLQRDFLKLTSQQILKYLNNGKSPLIHELEVDAKDRKHQVWKRNSLGIPLWSHKVFDQKLDYIHNNPVKAGLCECSEDYKYSSAKFYFTGK